MVPRPQKMPKAVNPANQAGLERLIEKRINLGASDRYALTLKKAIDSLQNCETAITSHAEACKLKHVGTHCATLICPPAKERQTMREKTRKTKSKAATAVAAKQDPADTASCSQRSVGNKSADSASPAQSLASSVASKQSRQSKRQKVMTSQQLATIAEKPTTKETNYKKAIENAQNWKSLGPLTWRVVLIIDARERQSEHVQAKCQMSGIPCEVRHLPIGDMAWIAQGFDPRKDNAVLVELMLGTIIERKTISDLKASLFGTRYSEQRKRLKDCGLPQLIFLIEGDLSKDLFKCPADTLHTAAWETRLHLGFSILQTAHLQDTVLQLKRMHRRILQRTFPGAFSKQNEALPNFDEAYRSQHQSSSRRTATASCAPTHQQETYRRRRRRLQSLNEMTFDIDPLPSFGMECFITYSTLKAKIELDREQGTKTVGSIHLAMLKQVPGFSHKKCQAVARLYPTFASLMEAYENKNNDAEKQCLVAEVSLQEEGRELSVRELKVGPHGSRELYVAYQTDDPETSQPFSTADINAIPRSISRETSSPSSTRDFATNTSKPVASNLWKTDDRMNAVPECIDLLSPVPATHHTTVDESKSLSPTDDAIATAVLKHGYKEPSPLQPSAIDVPKRQSSNTHKNKKKNKSINTSFGSLLDDSSTSNDEIGPTSQRCLLKKHKHDDVIEID